MSTAVVEPDTEGLEALDWDTACTARIPENVPECGNPATWAHLKPCGHAGLMCGPCVAKAKRDRHRLWKCMTCHATYSNFDAATVRLTPL